MRRECSGGLFGRVKSAFGSVYVPPPVAVEFDLEAWGVAKQGPIDPPPTAGEYFADCLLPVAACGSGKMVALSDVVYALLPGLFWDK